jgi:hypothetical protein
MNIIQRAKAPTPKFFRILRNIGAVVASASGTLVATATTLPPEVTTAITYLGVAGGVATAVSQLAVAKEEEDEEDWPWLKSYDDDDDA